MSNSVSECQEWRIADINRDGTSGTVDLFPKYILHYGMEYGGVLYINSNLRSWLNNDFYNGFTAEIKSAVKAQSFSVYTDTSYSNTDTISDKIVCLLMENMGFFIDKTSSVAIKAYVYPIFGTSAHYTASNSRNDLAIYYRVTDGLAYTYWTRSNYHNSGAIVVIKTNGVPGGYVSASSAVVACIRF